MEHRTLEAVEPFGLETFLVLHIEACHNRSIEGIVAVVGKSLHSLVDRKMRLVDHIPFEGSIDLGKFVECIKIVEDTLKIVHPFVVVVAFVVGLTFRIGDLTFLIDGQMYLEMVVVQPLVAEFVVDQAYQAFLVVVLAYQALVLVLVVAQAFLAFVVDLVVVQAFQA